MAFFNFSGALSTRSKITHAFAPYVRDQFCDLNSPMHVARADEKFCPYVTMVTPNKFAKFRNPNFIFAIKMEPLNKLRFSVIALHKAGHSRTSILKLLKMLGVKKGFIRNTILRYEDTGSTNDRCRSGRPRSARTERMIQALRQRIRRNPRRNQKKLAIQMKTSKSTVHRALHEDLGLRALKRTKSHFLSARLKKQRLLRCRELLRRYGPERVKTTMFTDKKNVHG